MSPTPSDRQPDWFCPLVPHGTIGLVCEAPLWVDTGHGRPAAEIIFRVDSGATHITIPAWVFAKHGLPEPSPETERELPLGTAVTKAPARVRPCRLRAWWNPQRAGHLFNWPALYLPGRPPSVPPILGLGGVVTECRWVIDGRPSPGFPRGRLTLKDTRGLPPDDS